jgi:hypothetical protein
MVESHYNLSIVENFLRSYSHESEVSIATPGPMYFNATGQATVSISLAERGKGGRNSTIVMAHAMLRFN